MTIGQQIRDVRKRGDLSQVDLAKRLGVFQSYISAIESDKDTLSMKQLNRFADALGCEVEIFLTKKLKA
jgi:transcriptional regulator with XRE-family HTH domain